MTEHPENRPIVTEVALPIVRSDPKNALGLSDRERSYRAMHRQRDGFKSDSKPRKRARIDDEPARNGDRFLASPWKFSRLHAPLGAARSIFCTWSLVFATLFMFGAEPAWANKTGAEHFLNGVGLACADCLTPTNSSDRVPAMLRTKTRPGSARRSGPRALRRRPEESAGSSSAVPTVLIGHSMLFREGLKLILGATQFKVVASAASLEELTSQSSVGSEAGIYILSAGDNSATVAAEIRAAKALYPSARCVVLHDHYDPLAVSAAMDAGAAAYLLKSNGKDALVKALEMVMLGSTVLPAVTRQPVATASPTQEYRPMPRATEAHDAQRPQGNGLAHHLSTREIETLYGLQAGSSNKHIARKFSIAEATVKVHVKAILRKIRVENRTQAAIWAIEHLPPRPVIERLRMEVGASGAPSVEPRDFRQTAAS
jgi:two-component system nitrate/nitrite response regulator NarL